MKVLLQILLLLGLASYIVLAVTKFNVPKKGVKCSALNIVVEDSAKAVFITPNEIRKILDRAHINPQNRLMSDVDCHTIEKTLKKNPFIDHSICFKTAGGQVEVRAWQRLPVIRIINVSGENYFIDSRGNIMPHMHYTADMAVATGHISHEYAKKNLIVLGKFLQGDSFWNDQVEQINVNEDGSIEIVPRVGEHTIYIGEPTDIPQKLQRLKIFYEKVLNHVGWNKYSRIDVEYDNQIICKK